MLNWKFDAPFIPIQLGQLKAVKKGGTMREIKTRTRQWEKFERRGAMVERLETLKDETRIETSPETNR
jgi:hypothetical protein